MPLGNALKPTTTPCYAPRSNLRKHGKFLMVDTLTGRCVIGIDKLALSRSLAANVPEAACTLRIGYPATTTIGGDLSPLREMTP